MPKSRILGASTNIDLYKLGPGKMPQKCAIEFAQKIICSLQSTWQRLFVCVQECMQYIKGEGHFYVKMKGTNIKLLNLIMNDQY